MIKNNKAFTLIELLVVIAILGVLALMASPKLFNYTQRAELTTIQSDVKVMQDKINKELMSDDELLVEWNNVMTDELITLTEGGNLYEVKGKVNPESLNADNFKAVPNEFKKEINTKLKGDFYVNNNGKVYYKHIKKLNIDSPSDGNESSSNGIYTQEEIDNLVNNEGYIEVKTAEDLNNVRNNLAGKYIQTANIDMSEFESFEPTGNNRTRFSGVYDGGGFEISNLTIYEPSISNIGLFSYTAGATIENVGLENADITGGSQTGGLVGHNSGKSVIKNSYSIGSVTGRGIHVGGLVGYNSSSTVSNSYAIGSVIANSNAGGLVGYNYNNSTVSHSYTIMDVSGSSRVGGLIGYNNGSSVVENSHATGAVFGTENEVGGLIGQSYSSSVVKNSYATGAVTGTGNRIGGLVGYNHEGSSVENSYATGAVTGNNQVGGLVGYSYYSSRVNNSYATGLVTGIGRNTGGLVGTNQSSTVGSSYYDTVTTGKSASSGGTGKSTEEMKMKNTYNGWNFDDVWKLEEGVSYPTLR